MSLGKKRYLAFILLCSTLVSRILTEEPKTSPIVKKDTTKDIYNGLKTISETISNIEKKAFRDADFNNIIQNSLKTLVSTLDAHSAFFTEETYKATIESTSGQFSGIGVSIISKNTEDDALVIVDVIQTGPAEKAGLKSGDKIIEVNGEKIRGLATDEVINKLKGKTGSTANIKIIRDKKVLEFKIKREIIKDQASFCYQFKTQNIYYLSLKIFAEKAASQVCELLQKANAGECKGIILDLRRNPGGILDCAVEMASLFLEKGSLVVITKDREGQVVSQYQTKTDPILKSSVPIFILIDNFTASASEILAGCLKYYSEKSKKNLTVFLLGTSTFGKGSVQEVIPISGGCALKLTTMLYYLPNHESIQALGIEPDFLIKPKIVPIEDLKLINDLYGKETSFKNHITVKEVAKNNGKYCPLKDKKSETKSASKETKDKEKDKDGESDKEKEKSFEEKQQEAIIQDNQIQAAVNMINLLSMAKKCNPDQISTRQKAIKFLKDNYLTDEKVDLVKVK